MAVKKIPELIYRNRILWHIIFWISIYLFYSLTYGSLSEYGKQFISNLFLLPVRIVGTYVFIYYLVPLFLLKRKYITFSMLAIIHALLYGFTMWIVLRSFVYCLGCIYESHYALIDFSQIFRLISANYEIPAIAAMIVITKRWYKDIQIANQLEREKLEAELKYIKSNFRRFYKDMSKYLPNSQSEIPLQNLNTETFINLKINKKIHKIKLEEILFIESINDYINIHMHNRKIIAKYTLSAIEDMLPDDKFLRIHRSYIVSIDSITGFSSATIDILDIELPIGRNYRTEVSKILHHDESKELL
jgi:two-component system, LytTR family, response regulator LytT